ncbi:hypothetical protein TNCV_2703851 [Trichonephila clavipes]|nr:hypothetical protein TNCV_2703851 [Trichonephila clavipes]
MTAKSIRVCLVENTASARQGFSLSAAPSDVKAGSGKHQGACGGEQLVGGSEFVRFVLSYFRLEELKHVKAGDTPSSQRSLTWKLTEWESSSGVIFLPHSKLKTVANCHCVILSTALIASHL